MHKLYIDDLDCILNNKLPWNELKGKNVLVTGGTGLIGSCIIDVLMRLGEVNIFCMGRNIKKAEKRFGEYWENKNFHFIFHNVNEKLELNITFDYIFHAASGAHPDEFNNHPVETMTGNFIGTYNLLNYGKEHNLKRFVYVSSGEVYGKAGDKIDSFNEEYDGYLDLLKTRSCYPSSKRASETLLASFINEYNLDGVIVRPCHIYGPTQTNEDSRVSADFIRKALNGEDIVLKSKGKQVRSYLYVTDAVLAMFYVLFYGEKGEAYNIAGKEFCTIREFADIVAEKCGVNVVIENDIDIRARAILDCNKLYELGFRENNKLVDGIYKTIDILQKL